jgi:flagellar protein FliT
MQLHLVESINYTGPAGLLQVRSLQQELNAALAAKDWDSVRRLDRSCAAVVHKVITANEGDSRAIANALSELKGVYASLLVQCKREVASLAH